MSQLDQDYILQFLQTSIVGTVSTVTADNKPDAAVVYCYVTDDFDVYFLTKEGTQKTLNMRHEPEVVITIPPKEGAVKEFVHIRGVAVMLESTEIISDIMAAVSKLSGTDDVETVLPILKHDSGKLIVTKVMARHIRMRTYKEHGVETREIDL